MSKDDGAGTATSEPTEEVHDSIPVSVRWIGPGGLVDAVTKLEKRRLRIGRSPACDVVLAGGETSRVHAVIECSSAGYQLTDGDSHNGTFVNGQKCPRAALEEGTVIRVGDWVGVVMLGDGEVFQVAPDVWGSTKLKRVLEPLERIAPRHPTVLLLGETGTGKDLVARAVAKWSERTGPFVAFNCGALAESLVESELFGHKAGAFTGASVPRSGHFRAAHHGVLFLDEVGDLSPRSQVGLLRVLQEREVLPVGSSTAERVDVMVVAATNVDLAARVRAGKFREDLLARLDGITRRLPPLRERRGDIWSLFSRFVRAEVPRDKPMPRATPRFVEAVLLHEWKRNVRELESIAQRLAHLHPFGQGEAVWHRRHFDEEVAAGAFPSTVDEPYAEPAPVRRVDPTRAELVACLDAVGGNVTRVAEQLGVSRQHVYNLLDRHGLRDTPRRH